MAVKKRRKLLKMIKPKKKAEIFYRSSLNDLLSKFQGLANKNLSLYSDDHLKALTETIKDIDSIDISKIASDIAKGFTDRVNLINARSVAEGLAQSNLSIPPPSVLEIKNSSLVNDDLQKAIDENISLISSVKGEYTNRLNDVVQGVLYDKYGKKDIISQMAKNLNITENRAKIIARDQTAKLNGTLTQKRHDKLGIKLYIWRCVIDGRERKSHAVLDGMLCDYEDSTIYSDDEGKTWKKRKEIGAVELKPSVDYCCRCIAQAKIEWV